MKKIIFDINAIISAGANVIVNAGDFTTIDLRSMAVSAKSAGVKLTVKGASNLTTIDCRNIANAGNHGTVTFDFSE